MNPEKEKELRDSLNSLLIDLKQGKENFSEVYEVVEFAGMPLDEYLEKFHAVNTLEGVKFIPIGDSLDFVKELINIESILKIHLL